jgi:ribosomal protein L23
MVKDAVETLFDVNVVRNVNIVNAPAKRGRALAIVALLVRRPGLQEGNYYAC